MASLRSMPREVIVEILANCETVKQVTSFAAACKFIHYTWLLCTPSILNRVGSNSILYFESALLVVRATNIVKASFEAGQLPPSISPLDIQLRRPGPSISEFKQILDLQELIQYVEEWIRNRVDSVMALAPRPYCFMDLGIPDCDTTRELPILTMTCRYRLQRTMYRTLLAGAVCSRAYNEPFWASDAPAVFRERFTPPMGGPADRMSKEAEAQDRRQPAVLTHSDFDHLQSFAAFSLNRSGVSGEHAFPESYANWFAEDVRNSFLEEQTYKACVPNPEISEEGHVKAEISSMAIVLGVLRKAIINADGSRRNLRTVVRKQVMKMRCEVNVVVFGVFQPEVVALPPLAVPSSAAWLIATPVCPPAVHGPGPGRMNTGLDGPRGPALCDVGRILGRAYRDVAAEDNTVNQNLNRPPFVFLDHALLKVVGAPNNFDTREMSKLYAELISESTSHQSSPGARYGSRRHRQGMRCRQRRHPTGLPPELMYGISWGDSSAS